MKPALVLTVCLAAVFAVPAHAMRCDDRLIGDGDRKPKVLALCGSPQAINEYTVFEAVPLFLPPTANRVHRYPPQFEVALVPVHVEEWTYDFGSDRFVHHVRFVNGTVRDILIGTYGQ